MLRFVISLSGQRRRRLGIVMISGESDAARSIGCAREERCRKSAKSPRDSLGGCNGGVIRFGVNCG